MSTPLFLFMHLQDFIVDESTTEDNEGMYESESSESLLSASSTHHQASQTVEKDLIMVKPKFIFINMLDENFAQH